MSSHGIPEAFLKICELGHALGMRNIKDLPGCWEHQVDDHWWIATNAHRESIRCSKDIEVPSCSTYIEFNGWPAGIITPAGGQIAAGEAANEDAFLAALDGALIAVEENDG